MRRRTTIAATAVGAAVGYFILSPLAMYLSDWQHGQLLPVKPAFREVFQPQFFPWAVSYTLLGMLVGMVGGLLYGNERQRRREVERSRRHFELLLNSLGENIVTIDRDYRIVSANRAFLEFAGVESEENVRGDFCYRRLRHRDRACGETGEECPTKKVFETGEAATGVHLHKDSAGGKREVEITAYPIEGPSGEIVQVVEIMNDLTERKRIWEETRKSEEKFRTFFDAATDAIFLHDLKGRIIDVNRTACENLGYSREEMLAMSVSDIDAPLFAAGFSDKVNDLQKKGRSVFESAHVRKDGTVMPVEIHSRVLDYRGSQAIFSFVRDITQRKEAERQLRESEEKYSNLYHKSNDAIFIHDLQGRVLEANPKALDLFGYSRDEIPGLTVVDLHPSEALASSREAFEAIQRDGHTSFEVNFKRRDGSVFAADVSSSLFELKDGQVIQGIVRDITERKHAERAAREYAVQLEHMNYLKDLFTDILSHDLMNPASVVSHVSTLLAQREHPRDSEEVEMIARNASRIMQLIRSASTYARLESADSLEKGETDLAALVAACMESLRPVFEEKGIRVHFEPPGKAPAHVNPMVEEVFENILSNAVKYSPAGSTVTVTIEEGDDRWLVTVADEGEGIPDAYKEAIFARFERREKGGVKGSGLGLAIARRITELHGGRVWVEDNPGGGSRFRVSLIK